MQLTHFNHFQCIHILNLTYTVIREGIITHLQRLQLRTVLQVEMTIWITSITLLLREAARANHNTLQLIHPNQSQFIHVRETMIPNLQSFQLRESIQIQFSQTRLTNTIVDDDLSHSGVKRIPIADRCDSCLWIVFWEIGMVSQSANVYSSSDSHNTLLNNECPSND